MGSTGLAKTLNSSKSSYHINHKDQAGGEFIDRGTINGRTIGDRVKVNYSGEDRSGKIVDAHKYPNGRVEYTVKMSASKYSREMTKTMSESRFISKKKRK